MAGHNASLNLSTDSGDRHMQSLQSPDHSLQRTPTLRNGPPSLMGELFAEDGLDGFVGRWEPQTLIARTKYTDPYTAWLNQREAQRRTATATAMPRPAGRFGRNQPHKAPWDAILVTLSPDGR
jgi:hypothetical protein